MILSKRTFLLPVTITVSLLVIILGMKVPNYAKPLKSKSSPRAVLEVQAKETKEGPNKAGHFAELRGCSSTFVPTTFFINAFHHETRCNTSIIVTTAPARASPAVCS